MKKTEVQVDCSKTGRRGKKRKRGRGREAKERGAPPLYLTIHTTFNPAMRYARRMNERENTGTHINHTKRKGEEEDDEKEEEGEEENCYGSRNKQGFVLACPSILNLLPAFPEQTKNSDIQYERLSFSPLWFPSNFKRTHDVCFHENVCDGTSSVFGGWG